MKFDITDTKFSISKTRNEKIRDWVMFAFGTIAIYVVLLIGYYICHMPLDVEWLVALFITCFGVMLLLNKGFLRSLIIEIIKVADKYYLGDKNSFCVHEEKKLIVYDRFGEFTVDVIGHLYLRIGSKEFVLSYGVSEKEMFEIKKKLESFFSEELKVEYKTKYWLFP